jgi:dephospho-CoA kinase
MPNHIIGLVGQSGCGKGTVADILINQYGAAYSRFSAVLGDILTRLHIERSRDNFIALSNALRTNFGEDVLSYAIEKDAVLSSSPLVVIDGIRRPEDIVALEPLPFFKLVSIEVPGEIRYERMKKRGEKSGEQHMTWQEFVAQDHAPTEVTIPLVMERAWKKLDNSKTAVELEEQVKAMMKELGYEAHQASMPSV